MNIYLAIDIGASSGRHIAAWLEKGRICTREVYRFPNEARMNNGRLCWDLTALENHVIEGLASASHLGLTPQWIGIDTWGVDYVLLDENDHPLGDAVAYRDDRTRGMDALLEQSLPFERHYEITGIARQPFNTVYQLMALQRQQPEAAQKAAGFLFMPAYLSFLLTGKKAHEWTECTTGALCDAHKGGWSQEIIRAAGLPLRWFNQQPCPPGTPLGCLRPEIARQVGFDAQVILPATHDTGSAFMAVPALDEGAAFLSSGTWSLLGTELDAPVTSQEACRAGFTNEGGWQGTTRFLKNIMGMWMLQCIHRETDGAYSYAEMAQLAAQSTYPAWVDAVDNRFLAPASMLAEVRQALHEQGAPEPDGLPDVLRAITMGLAVCYRDTIADMSRITGKRFTSLNIVGGGSQNVVLNQMTADMTGLPVYSGPTEGTALGNLAAQMIAAGELTDLASFRRALPDSFPVQAYYPQKKDT